MCIRDSEYTLLEFNKLIEWIYASEDEFRKKRANAIIAREKLVQIIDSGDLNYNCLLYTSSWDAPKSFMRC